MGAIFDPRGMLGKNYVKPHIKPFGEDFFMFSHRKYMGANDPRGGAMFDPRGMVGKIYNEDHYTLLHTKYESSGPCGFRENVYFLYFSHDAPGAGPV